MRLLFHHLLTMRGCIFNANKLKQSRNQTRKKRRNKIYFWNIIPLSNIFYSHVQYACTVSIFSFAEIAKTLIRITITKTTQLYAYDSLLIGIYDVHCIKQMEANRAKVGHFIIVLF